MLVEAAGGRVGTRTCCRVGLRLGYLVQRLSYVTGSETEFDPLVIFFSSVVTPSPCAGVI